MLSVLQCNLCVQTEQRARELRGTNVGIKLVVVGKKGMTYFNRRRDQYDIAGDINIDPSMTCCEFSPASLIRTMDLCYISVC